MPSESALTNFGPPFSPKTSSSLMVPAAVNRSTMAGVVAAPEELFCTGSRRPCRWHSLVGSQPVLEEVERRRRVSTRRSSPSAATASGMVHMSGRQRRVEGVIGKGSD
jgi:hypothetical protein